MTISTRPKRGRPRKVTFREVVADFSFELACEVERCVHADPRQAGARAQAYRAVAAKHKLQHESLAKATARIKKISQRRRRYALSAVTYPAAMDAIARSVETHHANVAAIVGELERRLSRMPGDVQKLLRESREIDGVALLEYLRKKKIDGNAPRSFVKAVRNGIDLLSPKTRE